MDILLIGNGGREHALAWKLAQSQRVSRIFVAPGNGGTAATPNCCNVAISADDLPGMRRFARESAIDLTLVGPEAPLAAGIVDEFDAEGLTVFGPSKAAAQLEGSKAFSKQFMTRHAIPTGWAHVFTDFEAAADFVHGLDTFPVLKASGLAAGKGVLLPESSDEAVAQLRALMVERRFGHAGETVLVEERLHGPELSVLAFCDGQELRLMPAAQDHKRLLDGDRGPNTGGMGAFAPSPLATPALLAEIERTIMRPTLDAMAAEGAAYLGILYAGLMLTESGPKVLEYNCRFGDPEAQVILPLLDSDLLELILACVHGCLAEHEPVWSTDSAVTVVMASDGYPDAYNTGKPITGLPTVSLGEGNPLVFHAGTRLDAATAGAADQQKTEVFTDGGRVLSITATGCNFAEAVADAYRAVDNIQFAGAVWRTDIGYNAARSA